MRGKDCTTRERSPKPEDIEGPLRVREVGGTVIHSQRIGKKISSRTEERREIGSREKISEIFGEIKKPFGLDYEIKEET